MKKKIYFVALLLCVAGFLGSIFMVGYHWYQEKQATSRFEELVELWLFPQAPSVTAVNATVLTINNFFHILIIFTPY